MFRLGVQETVLGVKHVCYAEALLMHAWHGERISLHAIKGDRHSLSSPVMLELMARWLRCAQYLDRYA